MMIKKIFKRKATEELQNQPVKKLKPTYIPSSPVKGTTKRGTTYTVTCAFVGDKLSGKSNLLTRLGEKEQVSDPSPSLTPSINNDINSQNGLFEKYHAQLRSRAGNTILVTYCEASTREEHSRFRTLTYRMTDIFFLCFSTVDRNSFDNAKNEWFAEIDLISPDAPIYLIGTKCDLREKFMNDESERNILGVVSTEEGEMLKEEIGAIKYIETDLFSQSHLLKIIKEVGEVMLRQVESQEILDSVRSQSKQSKAKMQWTHSISSPCSPKQTHMKAVQNKAPKESIAVLPADYEEPTEGTEAGKENTPNALLSSPNSTSKPSTPKPAERISLKKLRNALVKKCSRKSKLEDPSSPLPRGLFFPFASTDPVPNVDNDAQEDTPKNTIKGGNKINSHIIRLLQRCDEGEEQQEGVRPANVPLDVPDSMVSLYTRLDQPASPNPLSSPVSHSRAVTVTDSEDDDSRDYFDEEDDEEDAL